MALRLRVISGGQKALMHGKLLNALPSEDNGFSTDEVISALREVIQEKEARIQEKEREKEARIQEKEREKEALIQEKELRIQEKEALFQEKEALFHVVLQEKDARLEDMKDALIKAKADISILKAAFNAETNLRPLLEMRMRDWYDKYKYSLGENATKLSMTKRFEKFVDLGLQGSGPANFAAHRHELQDCFDEAVKLGGLETKPQKQKVRNEMRNIYDALSEDVHDTKTPPGGIVGFVVNRNVHFAAAASAIMMYFGDSHSVFSRGYQELRYKWPVRGEEEEEEEEGDNI